jgi:hypothetical protein
MFVPEFETNVRAKKGKKLTVLPSFEGKLRQYMSRGEPQRNLGELTGPAVGVEGSHYALL